MNNVNDLFAANDWYLSECYQFSKVRTGNKNIV